MQDRCRCESLEPRALRESSSSIRFLGLWAGPSSCSHARAEGPSKTSPCNLRANRQEFLTPARCEGREGLEDAACGGICRPVLVSFCAVRRKQPNFCHSISLMTRGDGRDSNVVAANVLQRWYKLNAGANDGEQLMTVVVALVFMVMPSRQ